MRVTLQVYQGRERGSCPRVTVSYRHTSTKSLHRHAVHPDTNIPDEFTALYMHTSQSGEDKSVYAGYL